MSETLVVAFIGLVAVLLIKEVPLRTTVDRQPSSTPAPSPAA